MSSPIDEPAELEDPVAEDPEAYGFYTEQGGFMQLIPPGPLPDPVELSDEERQEAAQRYMQAKYADQATMYQVEPKWNLAGPPGSWEPGEPKQSSAYDTSIHQQIEKHYTDMVHRNPDGSDPLVDEPGP